MNGSESEARGASPVEMLARVGGRTLGLVALASVGLGARGCGGAAAGAAHTPMILDDGRVTDLAAQCVPEHARAQGLVQIRSPEAAQVQIGVTSGNRQTAERCLTSRLADYSIPNGLYSINLEPRADSTLPTFEYPIPKASSQAKLQVFPIKEGEALTVPAEWVSTGLSRAGFKGHFYWFRFLDGFAVLTTPEKINPDGAPISLLPQSRFDPSFDTSHFEEWLPMLWQTAKNVIFTDAVDRRVFLFTCASGQVQDTVPVTKLVELPSASDGEASALPVTLPKARSARTYHLRSFVYVFRQIDEKAAPKLIDTGIHAEAALAAAGILR
jgi:hypothetical protein